MAKKTKSLLQWCMENQRSDILSEIDNEKISKHYAPGLIPNRVEYNSPNIISWICEKGHGWQCEIVGRTLFGLKCPHCYPDMAVLKIGTKYGCLTIIDNDSSEIRAHEKVFDETIRKFYGKTDSQSKIYKCRCRCGKTYYMNQTHFLASRHKYCTEGYKMPKYAWMQTEEEKNRRLSQLCGLAIEAERKKTAAYRRVFDKNYNVDFSGMVFESLEILECVNDKYEKLTSYGDRRKKGAGTFTVYKLYKCRCYLCGKEQLIRCSDFHIEPPTEYGYDAYNGYWSDAKCDCHKISSFQWIVNKLLFDNHIPYRVEVSFPDLLGFSESQPLRFDFAIYDSTGSINCLIECQGEQHYKPVKEFGGEIAYRRQLINDERKRQYATEKHYKLIEIPFKKKKIDQVKELLIQNGILNEMDE